MTTLKITAPVGGKAHGPAHPQNNATDLWWVNGVMYVDLTARPELHSWVNYSRSAGYAVEDVAEIPATYVAGVADLRAEAAIHGYRPAVASQDGMDPDRRNYLPTAAA